MPGRGIPAHPQAGDACADQRPARPPGRDGTGQDRDRPDPRRGHSRPGPTSSSRRKRSAPLSRKRPRSGNGRGSIAVGPEAPAGGPGRGIGCPSANSSRTGAWPGACLSALWGSTARRSSRACRGFRPIPGASGSGASRSASPASRPAASSASASLPPTSRSPPPRRFSRSGRSLRGRGRPLVGHPQPARGPRGPDAPVGPGGRRRLLPRFLGRRPHRSAGPARRCASSGVSPVPTDRSFRSSNGRRPRT